MDKDEYKKIILAQSYRNVLSLSGRDRAKKHLPNEVNLPLCREEVGNNKIYQIELNKCDCRRCLKIENAQQKIFSENEKTAEN